MAEYKLKAGKKAEEAMKNVQDKFTEVFLEKDEKSNTGYTLKTGTIGEKAVSAYGKIEDTVVGGYRKIEDTVVGGYKKVEKAFVDRFLEEAEEKNENSRN